ncbi:helix-turn-helix transcriptional regulator [Mesobacillus subterraneus]|uniref:helix-turn-helix transcriptional regulator n=1 Tax=Mesobacillus subterraneus TaxID=285983 RepID=UPI00203B3D36|nr:helix-turn-helix transcriptional regulator [Mesobacillus subterraneus]MCM3665551.1 helix-turn-helix transcriptional regulator [Mesobacillus subterraneus]MCM3686110.1 helix-turn-helix transcriptional regulator [Mesobacillus subterraneus]
MVKWRNELKKYRLEAGYSQKEFAEMLGITVTHLNRVENHLDRNLSVPLATKAAQILNVPLDKIFLK